LWRGTRGCCCQEDEIIVELEIEMFLHGEVVGH
jgi:hypothetical protein